MTKSWLWPDHAIGKRESRRLREEHNALVNAAARLPALLETLRTILSGCGEESRGLMLTKTDMSVRLEQIEQHARAALQDAEGSSDA